MFHDPIRDIATKPRASIELILFSRCYIEEGIYIRDGKRSGCTLDVHSSASSFGSKS